MIWLASFPRSGNTFFRNVLYEVYGIESSTYHQDPTRDLDSNFSSYPVVKTHSLPKRLPAELRDAKSVYIIRDGRDSLVSMAHHRKDIVAPGSDYYVNLLLATLALNESYFGGWSRNVQDWTQKADIIIRFEDLIQDPIKEIEKLRAIIDLPAPNLDKLPTFEQLKFGRPRYGGGRRKKFLPSRVQKHFRRGKIGSWQDEMPAEIEQLFYKIHGSTLAQYGYWNEPNNKAPEVARRVLVEVSKVFAPENDGVKRYLLELLEHLPFLLQFYPGWTIDLYHNNRIQPIHTLRDSLEERGLSNFHQLNPVETLAVTDHVFGYEKTLLQFKARLKEALPSSIYNSLSTVYRKGPFRMILRLLRNEAEEQREQRVTNDYDRQLNSYDLIHSPLPQHYDFVKHLTGQHLFTVHDLTHELFPEFHTEDNIQKTAEGVKSMITQQFPVIAISQATKRDLLRLYEYPEDRIAVIYEGANGSFHRRRKSEAVEQYLEQYQLPNTPYFITLSTLEPRKNIKRVIEAFLQLKKEYQEPISLFICGNKGWKYEELFEDEAALNKAGIFFTGFVSDKAISVLFAHAIALCYVSLYEGFGLPVLEGMQSGIPVIYGNNSAMPEVAGQGGIGVNAEDSAEIKQAMLQLLQDPNQRALIAEEAWKQSTKFSWLKTAFDTLNYYEKLISENEER